MRRYPELVTLGEDVLVEQERVRYAQETLRRADENARRLWKPWRWVAMFRESRAIEERLRVQRTWPA